MPNFPVNLHKSQQLELKLAKLGVREQDVIEKFICSGGSGGQNVNKTSTCVYLKHIPTGTEVKFSQERSQSLNRFLAWRLLADKIEEKILGAKSKRIQAIEKIRRQKRKRSKRSKEKMLQTKKISSLKKQNRKVSAHEFG